ncbi:MAG: VanZ family protein [bacterium]
MLQKNKITLIYIALGIYWIALFIFTTIPSESMPSIGISDKFEHFGAYFLLSSLFLLSAQLQNKYYFLSNKPIFYTIIIILVYGAFDELHQMLVPGRDCNIWDWTANLLGVIAGVYFTNLLFGNWIRKNKLARATSY